jgi:D-aminopeptidase
MNQTTGNRVRLRELGIVVGALRPGPLNAITDVPGVQVGHTTRIEDSGPLRPGQGPIRTGVTVIVPHGGNCYERRVPAATHVLNGAGEMTGRAQVDEWGVLETPIYLTNTHNVGLVYDAAVEHAIAQTPSILNGGFVIPVVAECSDASLNDMSGRHVHREHVFAALHAASGGPVAEGNVGAGTGMMCYEFKGGIGTASRVVAGGPWTVGTLVLANHGRRDHLRVGTIPLGQLSAVPRPAWNLPRPPAREGSIIMVVATDAPLLPSQLRRLAVRSTLGMARTGAISGNGSGDLSIAFSTANQLDGAQIEPPLQWRSIPDRAIDPLFQATVEATEEAILNALCAAETMEGRDGRVAHALDLDELRRLTGGK